MALCTSCGSEVAGSASFCTACGRRMSAPAQPAAAMAVCPECGTTVVDASAAFCTGCGQRITASLPKAAVEAAALAAVAVAAPVAPSPVPQSVAVPPPTPMSASLPAVPAQPSVQATAPQPALHAYSAQPAYQPSQASGGSFRAIVLVLLLIIVVCGSGGWYLMGVETVIVCNPPGVTVFLDDKELQPTSFGRYVIPHLSHKTHFLKVQSPGFADTIERLDFPLTSLHEWVNIKLVPSRQIRR